MRGPAERDPRGGPDVHLEWTSEDRFLVVIPTYNERDNLPRVIPLVLAKDPRIEILVVDDASTDATEQAAYDLICQFSQVRVVRHGRRLGTSEAIQTGLQLSEGQAVFVHKEHEPLQPHHLERFIEARQQPPVVHQPILKDPPPMGAVACTDHQSPQKSLFWVNSLRDCA